MIVYFTCHDRILHHPILIKDQIFGSDGFHQHKICVNILVKAAKAVKAGESSHQHAYFSEIISPTYIFHQHLSPTYIFRH